MFNFLSRNKEIKEITEKLYGQNLELAVKNKTLSLLENLYQTSVLTLLPEEMAKRITDIIRRDLNLEMAGILIFDKKTDTLTPLHISKSERAANVLKKSRVVLMNITINDVSKHNFFSKAIKYKDDNLTTNIEDVWKELKAKPKFEEIKGELHIKTILLNPLVIGTQVLGVLVLGLNRNYDTLNTFEKASIRSFINVISLLLDKAYLYKNLQDSYEVTKRAYAVEKKAKEELEELDKVKNQFLSTTQHDLRTPLTTIIGYSSLIIEGTLGKQSKKTVEIMQKIKDVAENMKARANSFLDTAQFRLGKGFLLLKPGVEILPMLTEITNELAFKARDKKIELSFEDPKVERKLTVVADREKLKAAIYNIVDNAIKYTPTGSVKISVTPGYQMKMAPQIVGQGGAVVSSAMANNHPENMVTKSAILIKIADTGIGIHADKVKTLFEKQGERSEEAKKVAEGKGVGLYFSGQIIQYHHGQVWAESEGDNKGSTFFVALSEN